MTPQIWDGCHTFKRVKFEKIASTELSMTIVQINNAMKKLVDKFYMPSQQWLTTATPSIH